MRNLLRITSLMLLGIIAGCTIYSGNPFCSKEKIVELAVQPVADVAGPPVKFAVMSDIHVLAPSLCSRGKAFEAMVAADSKMTGHSVELFEQACLEVERRKPKFLIITGDLTKNGELESHLYIARRLMQLDANGIQVFVVPGNHDVLNGMAKQFTGNAASPVKTVSPEDFASIYRDFGYGQATDRDGASLSYAVQVTPRLLLIGLDTCRYSENRPQTASIPGGMVREPTLTWLKSVLAHAQGKEILVFMHHSLFKHFSGQEKIYSNHLLIHPEALAAVLAAGGVHYVFTGHLHANDITMQEVEGQKVFDIETGALVAWPCSYRMIELCHDGRAKVSTSSIEAIPSMPAGFQEYAKKLIYGKIKTIAAAKVRAWTFSQKDAEIASGIVADAYLAHYQGDESTYKPLSGGDLSAMNLKDAALFRIYKDICEGLKTDLPPCDLNVELDPAR